jgi:hypothetical protein
MKTTANPFASRANRVGKRLTLTIIPRDTPERALKNRANDAEQSVWGLPRRKMAGCNFRNGGCSAH